MFITTLCTTAWGKVTLCQRRRQAVQFNISRCQMPTDNNNQSLHYNSQSGIHHVTCPLAPPHTPTLCASATNSCPQLATDQQMWSADSTNYTTPRLCTKFGECAFSYTGLPAWNSLLADLWVIQETAAFRRRLKTHFSHWLLILCSNFPDFYFVLNGLYNAPMFF